MPQNALNVIDVIPHVDNAATYNLTPQDKTVLVTNIPLNGTTVFLPQKAQSGDRYQMTCDASCDPKHPLIVRATLPTVFAGPPFIGGPTFGGITTSFTKAESSVELVFEENTQSWWTTAQSNAVPQQILAESFTPTPATTVLSGVSQSIISKTITPLAGEVGEFFAVSIQVLNPGGAVTPGVVNATLFVDAVSQSAYANFAFPFGTEGLTTISFTGKLGLAPGAHTIEVRATATAGLEVVLGGGGIYIEQLGI